MLGWWFYETDIEKLSDELQEDTFTTRENNGIDYNLAFDEMKYFATVTIAETTEGFALAFNNSKGYW